MAYHSFPTENGHAFSIKKSALRLKPKSIVSSRAPSNTFCKFVFVRIILTISMFYRQLS
jgi:hypothetical protein